MLWCCLVVWNFGCELFCFGFCVGLGFGWVWWWWFVSILDDFVYYLVVGGWFVCCEFALGFGGWVGLMDWVGGFNGLVGGFNGLCGWV